MNKSISMKEDDQSATGTYFNKKMRKTGSKEFTLSGSIKGSSKKVTSKGASYYQPIQLTSEHSFLNTDLDLDWKEREQLPLHHQQRIELEENIQRLRYKKA